MLAVLVRGQVPDTCDAALAGQTYCKNCIDRMECSKTSNSAPTAMRISCANGKVKMQSMIIIIISVKFCSKSTQATIFYTHYQQFTHIDLQQAQSELSERTKYLQILEVLSKQRRLLRTWPSRVLYVGKFLEPLYIDELAGRRSYCFLML